MKAKQMYAESLSNPIVLFSSVCLIKKYIDETDAKVSFFSFY